MSGDSAAFRASPSPQEVAQRNRELYDGAADPVWQLAVYGPVHGGWEFTNMGGRRVLDAIGRAGALAPDDRVLELCSGLGDTCRYLATHYPCQVTGVEMNPQQVAKAEAHRQRLDPQLAGRLSFVEADITVWSPEKTFDLVYALDSLILVDDLGAVLAGARRLLTTGRSFVLVEILAGPRVTDELREKIWREDAMINLLTPAEYDDALRLAGFRQVARRDRTDLAVTCWQTIAEALAEHAEEIVSQQGEGALQGWTETARFYSRAFADGSLIYQQAEAR
ncbi:MAG: class I SAM-dependent methyltransferase [Acidobacteriota bacterium]